MPNTYNWIVSQLECYPEHEGKTNVVTVIHWRRRATDGVCVSEVYGAQNVLLDPTKPFTPFNNLTKSQVEKWLTVALGDTRISEIDASLAQQLQYQQNPSVAQLSLPWEV